MHVVNNQILNPKLIRRGRVLIFITLLLDIIAIASVNPVLPEYFAQLTGDDIRKSCIEGGKLLAVYSAMQFLFAPAIGNLSDRYGRRPILLLSLVSFMVDHIICAIAWSYSILFIGRLLSGLSGAGLAVCMAYLADISDDETRTRNFGLLGIASGLGFIVGSFIGGFLGQFSPRIPFYFAAGFSLIHFIVVLAMLPETLPTQNRRCFNIKRANPLGAFLQLRQYPKVLWVLLVLCLYWFAESIWPSIWAFIAKERYDWNSLSIALSYSVFGVGQVIVVALILPYFSKRWNNCCLVMVGLFFALVGALGYTFAIQGWMVYVVFMCTMLEYLVQPPMRAIASAQVPPNAQGELQGAMTSVFSLSLILGSIFYMFLFERFTQEGTVFYFSGAPFLGSFCMLIVTAIVFALRVR